MANDVKVLFFPAGFEMLKSISQNMMGLAINQLMIYFLAVMEW